MESVTYSREARKQMRPLPANVRSRISQAVNRLAETGHGDVKPIVGEPGVYRLRIGNWRIRFEQTGDDYFIISIKPRGSAYA